MKIDIIPTLLEIATHVAKDPNPFFDRHINAYAKILDVNDRLSILLSFGIPIEKIYGVDQTLDIRTIRRSCNGCSYIYIHNTHFIHTLSYDLTRSEILADTTSYVNEFAMDIQSHVDKFYQEHCIYCGRKKR